MNFDPYFYEKVNLQPFFARPTAEVVSSYIAEASVVRSIIQGSGGPENAEITESGLRFVRHLLSNCRATRFGFMPNLKDMEVIRAQARLFIRRCGSSAHALRTMYSVMQEI